MPSEESPRSEEKTTSKELLEVENCKVKHSDKLVFSLLQENKKAKGTFRVGPSSLLQRVKEFLPVLEKANLEIERDISLNPDKKTEYDIEHLSETSGPVIEMDLAVYEDAGSNNQEESDSEAEVPPLSGDLPGDSKLIEVCNNDQS